MTGEARSGHRGERYEALLRQERLILDVTEQLAGALESSRVTQAELARRMGRTPGFVSQLLGGGRNLTLRTIADIAAALSLRPSFKLSSKRMPAPAEPWAAIEVHEDTHEISHWSLRRPQVATTVQQMYPGSRPGRSTKRPRMAAVA